MAAQIGRRRRGLLTTIAASALVSGIVALVPSAVTAATAEPAPAATGWTALSRTVDRGGVEIIRLRREEPRMRARLAIFPRSQLARLRPVLASEQLVGGTGRQRTTTLCARWHCHVAVNGDRWVLAGHDAGRVNGAVAIDGDLIATQPIPPEDPYAHALIGGDGSMDGTIAYPLPVRPEVISGEVTLPVALNRQPVGDQITVLDRRYNPESRTPPGTVEYLMAGVGGSSAERPLAPIGRREGSGPIPEGGLVVAANGPAAIEKAEAWWAAALAADGATYRSGLGGVRSIVGGSPLLLDGSAYGFPLDSGDGRHPRTILGWDQDRVLLVAIDGRRPGWSVGATYIEAAQLMRWLGATDALNLDGGSSTTFVDHGALANWPSADTEEPVVEALVVLPPENRLATPAPPLSLDPACPPGRTPTSPFSDTAGNTHERAIACAAWWDVTVGTGGGTYGPTRTVRRDQMASFLARTLARSGTAMSSSAPDAFTDDEGNVHEASINALAALGVISGKGGGTFGPAGAVSRGQMAAFLARALPLATDRPLANTTDYFADDSGHQHEQAINQITEARVGSGTADGTYRAAAPVRRDQMAGFLARVLTAAVDAGQTQPPG